MEFNPDERILWVWGAVALNATIVYTWIVMAVLVFGSWLLTRRLTVESRISPSQNLLEVVVGTLTDQVRAVSRQNPMPFLPFIATLFLFIATANLMTVVPGFHAPTSSLSTTTALALCVFVAVPLYGIRMQGLTGYLRNYLEPSVLMLPFHIAGEFTRTLALAVRLYGNAMAGALIASILLALVPLFFPMLAHALEMLLGLIQAYIFATLALVYIASALRGHSGREH